MVERGYRRGRKESLKEKVMSEEGLHLKEGANLWGKAVTDS